MLEWESVHVRCVICTRMCVSLSPVSWSFSCNVKQCVSALYLLIFCWESLQCHCKVMTDFPSAADPPPDRHDGVCVCVCVCVRERETIRTSRWRQTLGIASVQNTGTSQKNVNIMKKVNIFCHSFQKVKPILYRFITHRVKYFKPLFLEILMIMAYR